MSNAEASIQKRLTEYRANPIQPLEIMAIQENFKSEDCSVESFKTIYRKDPIFCYTLIGEATKATRQRTSSPFAADHAMSTVGLKSAATLFAGAKPPSKPLSREVLFSLTSSLLAAELTKTLCEIHKACTHSYWTSLCYLMPDTMLWHMAPKAMWQIYYQQLTQPKSVSQTETAKLGFSVDDWRVAVAKELNFSEQNSLLFEKQFPNKPKELLAFERGGFDEEKTPSFTDWHRYEGWLIVMANRLARTILVPWHYSSYRHIFNLIYQLAGCDKKKLNKAIQSAIRTVSLDLQESTLFNPAVTYLMLKSRPAFPDWLAKSSSASTKSKGLLNPPPVAKADTSKALSAQAIKSAMQKIVAKPESFASSSELIQFSLKTLLNDLKLDRVSFLTVDYSTSRVACRAALSAKNRTKIKPDFEFKQPTPLSRFIERQTFMLLSKKAYKNIWTKMPVAVQKDNVEQFIMCSLKSGDKVNSIIYADTDDVTVLSPQRLGIIKKLLTALNRGLAIRNANKKENGPAKKAQAR